MLLFIEHVCRRIGKGSGALASFKHPRFTANSTFLPETLQSPFLHDASRGKRDMGKERQEGGQGLLIHCHLDTLKKYSHLKWVYSSSITFTESPMILNLLYPESGPKVLWHILRAFELWKTCLFIYWCELVCSAAYCLGFTTFTYSFALKFVWIEWLRGFQLVFEMFTFSSSQTFAMHADMKISTHISLSTLMSICYVVESCCFFSNS